MQKEVNLKLADSINDRSVKAVTFAAGNLKKFDVDGNDEDTEQPADFLDIYLVPTDLKGYLLNDSNWLSGGVYLDEIVVTGFADNGKIGYRTKGALFFYECVVDRTWTRYPIASSYFNPFNIPESEKAKLENVGNWTGVNYTGVALINCPIGSEHYSATHYFKFVEDNIPIRLNRV